jgi:hypothetical protein
VEKIKTGIKTMAEESLAFKYLEYMDKEDRGETFDDFFDWVGIKKQFRTDFAVAAILNQAQKIIAQ